MQLEDASGEERVQKRLLYNGEKVNEHETGSDDRDVALGH